MKRAELIFNRPETLAATAPASVRGIRRDEARLMVSTPDGHQHAHFYKLPDFLQAGDLLVVNESATLPASLLANGSPGEFILNLSTHYGGGLWLAEPRWSSSLPGPLPLKAGELIEVGGAEVRMISPFPGLPRLWFVQSKADLHEVMAITGTPIRYGYVQGPYPLKHYQTVFARVPGSAE